MITISKFLLIILVSLGSSIKHPNFSKNDECDYKNFMQDTVHKCYCEPFKEGFLTNRPSYLQQYVQGRLANMMWTYATLMAFKNKQGYRVFLEERVLENLSFYFKNIDQVEPIEKLCDHEDYPWHILDQVLQVLNTDEFKYGRYVKIHTTLRLLANNLNVNCQWHKLMEGQIENVQRAFTFRDHFVQGADKRITRFTNKLKEKHKSLKKAKEIVYVGMHIRHRDLVRDIVIPFGLPQITTNMYVSAMSMVVDKIQTKQRKVVFLVMTDDPLRVQNELMPRVRKKFFVKQAGSGHVNNRLSIGLDLAMMSRCNYTILSYGTYSYWAGFLSGGPKILPVHYYQGHTVWEGGKPRYQQEPFLLTDIAMPYDEKK